MINTIRGEMDEATLRKVEGSIDNENETTTWVEYWDGDELVHRSVHVRLKKGLGIEGSIGSI
jgi:hypothetical protein